MTHSLTVPNWHPARLNTYRGRHWSREAKAKKEAASLLGAYSFAERVPPAIGQRRVTLVITLGPRQRQPDRDAYDKVVLDALVTCGLLLSDSERGLLGRMEVEFVRGAERATKVVLEDVPG